MCIAKQYTTQNLTFAMYPMFGLFVTDSMPCVGMLEYVWTVVEYVFFAISQKPRCPMYVGINRINRKYFSPSTRIHLYFLYYDFTNIKRRYTIKHVCVPLFVRSTVETFDVLPHHPL